MITPRENFIRFLRNDIYEWIPTSFDMLEFRPAFIPDNVARALVVQQDPYVGEFGGKDLFGIEWSYVALVNGSIEKEPLFENIEDWEKYVRFPDLDAMDWDTFKKENSEYLKTDKLIHSTIYTGFYERLISFVGFENAAVAMIDEDQREVVKAIFEKLADLYIDLIRYLHRRFNVEIVEVHDDWGTQNSTMFSVETHTEMILPYIKKVVDAAHAEGVFIEQHSCGKVESLVPNIILSGADTWRGQDINDKKMLVEKYGDVFRFGIMVKVNEQMSDEELLQTVKASIDQYRGKRVWLAIMRQKATEEQEQLVRGYIKRLGLT